MTTQMNRYATHAIGVAATALLLTAAPAPAGADPVIPPPSDAVRHAPNVQLDPLCAAIDGTAIDPSMLSAAVAHGRVARALRTVPKDGVGLEGRRIALSAGHGIVVQDDGTDWGFQRSITNGLREDIHTNQWMIDFILPMLVRSGADPLPLREFDYSESAVVVDDTSREYDELGAWSDGASPGWEGGYRFANAGESASATWSFLAQSTGTLPVYAFFLGGENRASNARYTITHAAGETVRTVDQRVLGVEDFLPPSYPNNPPPPDAARAPADLWHVLGSFPFEAGQRYTITLDAADADGVVIADAVHIGAGMGSVGDTTGRVSGRPRWEESALSYMAWTDAPEWLRVNDVSSRPLYAIYRGVDAYLSLHTNCCNNSGTSTWTWYPEMFVPESSWPAGFTEEELPPGTYAFSDACHDAVIERIRATWDPDWDDEGHRGADFGEIRALRQAWYEDVNTHGASDPTTIPAFLMEVGYHDTAYDASLIRELGFRYEVARGLVAGIHRYFNGDDAQIPPTRVPGLRATSTSDGMLVEWLPAVDPLEPNAEPDRYRLWTSADGVTFRPELEVPATADATQSATVPLEGCTARYVRVTALNDAGESLDSAVVGAQRAALAADARASRVLFIDAVDREVAQVTDPAFLRSYARIYGPAISEAQPGIGFDMATDEFTEAAIGGRAYDAVVYAAGETSTRDSSVDLRSIVSLQAYRGAGGRVLLSGAEVGWDLVAYGTETDRAFFEGTLEAQYVADDAGVNAVALLDESGGVRQQLRFGDCTGDAACIEYPDVLAPASPDGRVLARYEGGDAPGAAIVQSADGLAIVSGFPLESLLDADDRHVAIRQLVAALLPTAMPGDGTCEGGLAPPDPVEPVELPDAGTPPEPPLDARPDDAAPADAMGPDSTPLPDAAPVPDAAETGGADAAPRRDTSASEPEASEDEGSKGGCAQHGGGSPAAPWAWTVLAAAAWRRRGRR